MNCLKAVKNKLKKRFHSEPLTHELLAQKRRKRSDEDCEKFCFGINCSYVVQGKRIFREEGEICERFCISRA
jgi:hypothetical protein